MNPLTGDGPDPSRPSMNGSAEPLGPASATAELAAPSTTPEVAATGASGWQPPSNVDAAPPVPGAPGWYFSMTVNRVAAYLLDSLATTVLTIPVILIVAINLDTEAPAGSLVFVAALGAISFVYFGLSWRSAGRATPAQRLFRMQVGNAFDGRTLNWRQIGIRWAALEAIPIIGGFDGLTYLAGQLWWIWALVLFVTTARSLTKQGLHDRWANSAVVAVGPQGTGLAWGCIAVGLILPLIVILAIVSLIFLGTQISEILNQMGTELQ